MKLIDMKYWYWTTVFSRLLFILAIFSLGILWYKWSSMLIVAVLAILSINYVFILPYFRSLINKKLVSNKGRLKVVSNALRIRIKQWSLIYNNLKEINPSEISNWEKIESENALNTKNMISSIILIIGNEFKKEIRSKMSLNKNIKIRIAYYQLNRKANCLELRHKENSFYSELFSAPENTPLVNDYLFKKNRSFFKNDGSTAGLAWQTNEPVFIANTQEELKRPDSEKRFKCFNDNMNTKSILCLPVSSDISFFGVLCISCNRKNIIDDSSSFTSSFLEDFSSIIDHIKLIEIIKMVHDLFWDKFNTFKSSNSTVGGGPQNLDSGVSYKADPYRRI